jgi:hypothetical protein
VAPLKSAVGAVGAVGATRLDRVRLEAEEEEIRRQLEEQREAIVHRARLRETDVQYNTLHCWEQICEIAWRVECQIWLTSR